MNQYPPNNQPNPYNQPTVPGQYYAQSSPPPTPRHKRMWRWYRSQRKRKQLGIGCGVIIAAMFLCICSAAIAAPSASQQPQASSAPTSTTTTLAVVATAKPTPAPTHRVQPTPTAVPTQKPTPVPTHQAQPTPRPTTPPPTGVNGNPWGYDFNTGNFIYNPPSNFCVYFNCIASFWSGSGYVEECQDQTYSKSGGRSGSCSHHGGNLQPLYSH